MFPFFGYIRNFYREAFHTLYFGCILVLMALLIWLNYRHRLEASYVVGPGFLRGFAGYYLLYFIPFALAFFIQPFFYTNRSFFRDRWFWIILLLAPAFFSLRVNFDLHQLLLPATLSADERTFWTYCSNWIVRVFVVLIPVFITWWIKDRKEQPFYGSRRVKGMKPYLLLVLIMLPLIALASSQADFLRMYPRVKVIDPLGLSHKTWRYLLFELSYGFDFISIEFFFRGFLVLSLLRICGPHCIIPIACFYCTIHFGKPLGEAISSFWGGLLLGIVSYHTRSIWGGLLVHLGIAWSMELGGWFGSWLKH